MTRRLAACLIAMFFAAAGQSSPAGTYKGKWSGNSASGDFSLVLEQNGDQWKATVRFTLGETEVPATVRMLRVEGSKVETKYDFDLGGNKLQSHLEGEVKDGVFHGRYKTKALADDSGVDEGACEAKRQ
jgi:hypothetical protein